MAVPIHPNREVFGEMGPRKYRGPLRLIRGGVEVNELVAKKRAREAFAESFFKSHGDFASQTAVDRLNEIAANPKGHEHVLAAAKEVLESPHLLEYTGKSTTKRLDPTLIHTSLLYTLGSMRDTRMLDFLTGKHGLTHGNHEVRQAAANSLKIMGERASPALSFMRGRLNGTYAGERIPVESHAQVAEDLKRAITTISQAKSKTFARK